MPFRENFNNANAMIIGASQGIGLGFVKQLIQDTRIDKIYATHRQEQTAQELLDLTEEYPDKLNSLQMDITDESQIVKAVQNIRSQINKLHLVINCVGLLHEGDLQPEKSLKHINPENLLRYFQINSIGAVLLAKHLLPLFRHQEPSVFASISAKVGSIGDNQLGGWYGYRASKAALNMLMRTTAIEYGRISPQTLVVTLHPGTTDTRLSRPFQRNVPPEKLFSVERTVSQLLTVIEKLEPSDSGQFFSWDGSKLPW
ncbi:SDR family NAD(P)-dependent oxidoreductase [Nostoc spongiaeforme FACHB-130]|uniref:SDR family NAD(P)-dependent oxidoreductase n=1 Tax=Nostoc spongiaeforme FACHB-130 TaxID=1357510 RepID=A0ABR8FPL7_9NOSO|nr:SDR family NAD(P)-dependent oxidoreductase [Nostoc spongiaeforme]MBD2592796.1 SDR family NAD(P)-dependent oxidoreductase [Nostoc spongiaeforme FACHB-130]